LRVGRANYVTCLAILAVAYSAYIIAQKYKLYYFGWTACALITAGLALTKSLRIRRAAGAFAPLVAFYTYLALTSLWSYSPARTLYYLATDLLMPTAFVLALIWAQNTDREDLGLFFEMTVLANLLVIAYSLVSVGEVIDESYYAIRSSYGFAFATAIPFLVWRSSLRGSIVARTLLLLCVGLLAILGSRTGLLALPFLLAGSFLIVWRLSPRRAFGWLAGFLTTSSVVLAIAIQAPGIRESFDSALSRFNQQNLSLDISSQVEEELSSQDAVDIDRRLQAFAAVQSFLESPIIGRGYMSTAAKTEDMYGREISAHGLPFTLLGETGLIGTVLFLLVLASYFRRLFRLKRLAATPIERGYYLITFLTMGGMLIFGMSQQLHQTPAFFVTLAWVYGLRPAPASGPMPAAAPPASIVPAAVPS